jgi:hypothetical protein
VLRYLAEMSVVELVCQTQSHKAPVAVWTKVYRVLGPLSSIACVLTCTIVFTGDANATPLLV